MIGTEQQIAADWQTWLPIATHPITAGCRFQGLAKPYKLHRSPSQPGKESIIASWSFSGF